jgi:MoaA/NifB/PqqE/SkfB family radical SAM enzyme
MTRRHDIEADWVINEFCNYSCTYCFHHTTVPDSMVGAPTPAEYADFFRGTGMRWLFHFTGGEPLLYPGFVDLCAALTDDHFVALNTNLTTEVADAFCATVPADRVDYIHGALHPRQRERRDGLQALTRRVVKLRDAGFPLFLSCVMEPGAFAIFPALFEHFAAIGVPLLPKALRGTFAGAPFPESYSGEQRELFRDFAARAMLANTDATRPFRHDPTINPSLDSRFLDGFPDFTGISCSAGKRFVRIRPDGTVHRCGSRTELGNIRARTLSLLPDARPCDDSCCPYVCLRYSAADPAAITDLPRRVNVP